MTFDEIKELLATSAPREWASSIISPAGEDILVFNADPRVTMRVRSLDTRFRESWAVKHMPDGDARKELLEVMLNGHVVHIEHLVAVDGHRAVIPHPDRVTTEGGLDFCWQLSAQDYNLGRLVGGDSFDEYVRRCGLGVPHLAIEAVGYDEYHSEPKS